MTMHARLPSTTNAAMSRGGCISASTISGAEIEDAMRRPASRRPSFAFAVDRGRPATPPTSRPGIPERPYTIIEISPACRRSAP